MSNQVYNSYSPDEPIGQLAFTRFSHFSEGFLNKLFLCLSSNPKGVLAKLCLEILNNKSMEEIAHKFIEDNHWDGNYLTSSDSALFNAFICFKQAKYFDPHEAKYLCTRGGSFGSFHTYNEFGEFKMIFIGPKDFIKELDGEHFGIWLNNLADIADKDEEDEYEDDQHEVNDHEDDEVF